MVDSWFDSFFNLSAVPLPLTIKLLKTLLRPLVVFTILPASTAIYATPKVTLIGAEVPPFSWQQENKVVGINMDVAAQAAQSIGYQVDRKILPLKRALSTLSHQPNTLMAGLARTPEREHLYTWIGPVVSIKVGLLSWQETINASQGEQLMAGSAIESDQVDSIASEAPHYRAKLCVHYDTPMEAWLKNHGETDYISVTSEQACLSLLAEKLVKHWFTEFHLARYLTSKSSYPVENLSEHEVLIEPELYLAGGLNMSSTDIEKWRMALEQMVEAGDIDKIIKRYVDNY
ncbi:substrate-binding periplasmic protein [Thalassotalea euphylliae]|uniref:substrate-binding periplasmic protein n=1 Tax=Thalassotalea euphylliae TaxID=1655234 RepID=UPI0015F270C7|nr:transporter substrate-binding domain-containing protein [Thalassotalea euphylliae]